MREEPATLPIGAVIRKCYTVEGLLGKGGSGAVYLVRDQRVRFAKDNLFVLKKIKGPSQQEWHRLTFEDVSLKRLYHHALPRVHRVFNDDTHHWVYIVMEYIEGPNLEMLRQQQPEKRFSYLEAMNFMAPIIDAVSYLHRQQPPIIHRDIKPINIIVPKTGARAVLVDFGIDMKYGPVSTSGMVHSYAPNYKAPELYSGGGDKRTDIYGLGATFYTLLTGIVPADARSRMSQSGSTGIDPLEPVNKVVSAVPMRIGKAIDRAMSLDRHRRFSSVEQFWEALWSLVEHPVSVSDMPSVLAGPSAVSVPTPEQAVEHTAAAMLLPKPSSVVSMVDSVKEPEDLDATEPLPKLPPVVLMPDAVKEQEGPDTIKPLPEAPQIVSVPDTLKEQEDLDAAKPLPEPLLVVPMSISIKEQEDLDDVMPLPMPPRVERASISWRKLGALFIALALLISLGIGLTFLSYEQSHPAAHPATPAPTATSPAHTRPLLPLRQPSIQR
jgi:serine/threonine protein kinase